MSNRRLSRERLVFYGPRGLSEALDAAAARAAVTRSALIRARLLEIVRTEAGLPSDGDGATTERPKAHT